MRGRKPKPPKLKLLHGQVSPDKVKAPSPPPSEDVAEPFDWMSDAAKREWQRVAPQLAARGLLTRMDQHCLAAYCETVANYIEAKRMVEQEGSTYTHNGLVKKHPAVGMRDQAARDMAMFARELGLVPTSRQRLGGDQDPDEPDPLSEFLNPKRKPSG